MEFYTEILVSGSEVTLFVLRSDESNSSFVAYSIIAVTS